MKQLLTKSILLLFLLVNGMVFAQTPFWSETFTAGIPAGWTNVDASGQNIVWEWCPAPAPTPACAPVFGGQQPFQAATAGTGFVHVNSDAGLNAPLPQNHVSRLTTTAINCTGKSEVWVQFQSHIGTFEQPLATNAILRVSTNLTTWTNFTPFPGLTAANYFSPNPYFSLVDISSVAANQGTVYLQWQWTANWEYMWDLDDVELFDANPAPANDLAIGDFFYPPSSLAQPVSQIATDTFAFGADLSNLGSLAQTNVVLRVAVTTDTDTEIWADSIVLPTLAPGITDSFFQLPNRYAPELPVGSYIIKYTLRSNAMDERPADNRGQSIFLVTNSIFSKEVQPQTAYRPGGNPTDWSVGNMYQMSAGSLDQYRATQAQFSFTTNAADLPITDVESEIYLFRVADDVDFNVANGFDGADFLSPDLEWLGVASYSAPDTMAAGLMQGVEILDLISGNPGVILENGARYILAVSYSGTSNRTFHAFNEDVKMFFVSTLTYSDQWYTGGFGEEFNAVARLVISLVNTTDNKPLPETSMKVFPNPVLNAVNLTVNFDQPTDATITIADMTGRVIVVQDRQGLTQENLTYQVSQLAQGTYLARIATTEGTLTKKFVKM
jgi:hypothetical protein